METGQTVVLLNLENLYESLYDALNQVSHGIFITVGYFRNYVCLHIRPDNSGVCFFCSI